MDPRLRAAHTLQFFHRVMITGMQLRTTTVAVVFHKALQLGNAARQSTTVGEMVNLMSVDAQVRAAVRPVQRW